MSDDKSPGAHTYFTGATSPKDEPRRFEPITRDRDYDLDGEGSESPRPTGTIRRNRPPAISTSSADHYGMISL